MGNISKMMGSKDLPAISFKTSHFPDQTLVYRWQGHGALLTLEMSPGA